MAWPFLTQRLANNFPLWTKLRSDPSSFGQRFYSTAAESFESARADLVKTKELVRILPFCLEPEDIYSIQLSTEDEFRITRTLGKLSITYPTTIDGVVGLNIYSLDRVEQVEDLFYSLPERLSVAPIVLTTDFILWQSTAPTVYKDIAKAERLHITVDNSANYKTRSLDSEFGGHSGVLLKGEDENYIEFEEYVEVRDDGCFLTREIYKNLLEVSFDGFDGDVTITLGGPNREYEEDIFRVAVLPEMEGPLRYTLENHGGENYLKVFTPIYLEGKEYRRDDGIDEPNEEIIAISRLLDSVGSPYGAIDHAISPYDSRFYVLGDNGVVHIYEPGLSEFIPPATQESYQTYIELVPLYNRVSLNETLSIFTWFRVMRAPVSKVRIKKVAPDGTIAYLQANLTWAGASYYFPNSGDTVLPENSWTDKTFSVLFDQLGQWELYLEVSFIGLQGEVFTSQTSIMCEFTTAEVSIDTGIVNPVGMYFSHDGSLCITTAAGIYPVTFHSDVYYADTDRQRIFMKEQYDEVEVTYV